MVAGMPRAGNSGWPRPAPLPLAVWAAAGAGGTCLVAVAVVALPLAVTGHLDPTVATGLGAIVTVAAALVVGLMAGTLGRSLDVLRQEMAAFPAEAGDSTGDSTGDPTDPPAGWADPAGRHRRAGRVGRLPRLGLAAAGTAELVSLARALAALRLRAQIATEVAARHRRSAETAGAGMFQLLSGLVQAEEGARGQLAAELHDTVAQSLALAKSVLATAVRPEEIAEAADQVNDAEEQVRAVMARTRPPPLRDGDLASAVAVLREDLHLRYGLQVTLSWPMRPHRLPLATAVTVYRFFQEALLNVVKHSDVDQAVASLEIGDAVVAVVRDEGPGFDVLQVRADRGRHVGLGLLRERARLAGGTLRVESSPWSGTQLELRLPRHASAFPGSDHAASIQPRSSQPQSTEPPSTEVPSTEVPSTEGES